MERPNMNPLLHSGNKGIIRGFHCLDPLGGLGKRFKAVDLRWDLNVSVQGSGSSDPSLANPKT